MEELERLWREYVQYRAVSGIMIKFPEWLSDQGIIGVQFLCETTPETPDRLAGEISSAFRDPALLKKGRY